MRPGHPAPAQETDDIPQRKRSRSSRGWRLAEEETGFPPSTFCWRSRRGSRTWRGHRRSARGQVQKFPGPAATDQDERQGAGEGNCDGAVGDPQAGGAKKSWRRWRQWRPRSRSGGLPGVAGERNRCGWTKKSRCSLARSGLGGELQSRRKRAPGAGGGDRAMAESALHATGGCLPKQGDAAAARAGGARHVRKLPHEAVARAGGGCRKADTLTLCDFCGRMLYSSKVS